MNKLFRIWICTFACAVVWLSGCATEKELQERSVNRFVKDDVYRNTLKGYAFTWPSKTAWRYQSFPEFDVCFNHVDGLSQVFVTGVRGLIRREYPDGFVDWILDRLQARDISVVSRNLLTDGPDEMFQIFLDCRFTILSGQQYGVERKVAVTGWRRGSTWLAAIYLAPEKHFSTYQPAAWKIVDSIRFIQE
ncbi:hypothetical protein JXA40_07440 [bacterium]|nr:hypothetical protein [candidate division CSSED10-310 bacterium]